MFPMPKPGGALDLSDPRFKAWGTPVKAAPFAQTEPLISIKVGSDHMLIEGYVRSILWVRSPAKSLLMWVPCSEPDGRPIQIEGIGICFKKRNSRG